ncbi:MAG: magnesium-translocating P-type ATPase [Planctomycetes bacterium]|nr:magnesium-translocating P-type ATPase [Planctomycetota bacterium]
MDGGATGAQVPDRQAAVVAGRLRQAAAESPEELFAAYDSSANGLTGDQVEASRDRYGENVVSHGQKETVWQRLVAAFVNPFTVILFGLAVVTVFSDIIVGEPDIEDIMTVIIILAMVLVSGVLRFVQETRSGNAAEDLLKLIHTTTNVERMTDDPGEIPLEEVVVGDIVHISAGDMLPADVRLLSAKDLFVSQSSLTGESEPVEKLPTTVADGDRFTLTEYPNLAFMGTNVVSGSAKAMVLAVGDDTIFGGMAKSIEGKPPPTSFEKGVNSVSWVLIRFMLVMVPLVFVINAATKGNWLHALTFAISVAVGLTPEMLPMIVTTCLAKGAVAMSREKTVIKNLNSIQNLGYIDVLCTDKTGTLTQDRVVLEYHLNVCGEEDDRVLRYAFLNSFYQTGLKNLMDVAIINRTIEEGGRKESLRDIAGTYTKVDEIPFDFTRRRMSVVVKHKSGRTHMITKGAIEEMLEACSQVEYDGGVVPLTEELRQQVTEQVDEYNADGFRVLGIAQKTDPRPAGAFSIADETDMVLMGFLAFLDPPKDSAGKAVTALAEHGVVVKVLTGDNDKVARSVCRQVGIESDAIVLGTDVDTMTDAELADQAEANNIFAKLSPGQKARVITVLRDRGHAVGYMGDGINDAAGMKASDVGISVDTAVDIAKESAAVILLEKDLMVLEKGIEEGRKTYANMIKYIKMTASSNFGNMFSVLIASAFLPFLPMLSIHLLLLNLIYDISCTAIPWDNVDAEYLRTPRKWDASSIGRFMVWFGPTSSVFDITTYLLLYYHICPMLCGGLTYKEITDPATKAYFIALFQAGWFVESMWTQSLVVHMIRTPKIPFIQSWASWPVMSLSLAGIAVLTAIPFTRFGALIGLAPLPESFFGWLALTVLGYMLLVTIFKRIFIRRYGELL